jgi:hypothetical protein
VDEERRFWDSVMVVTHVVLVRVGPGEVSVRWCCSELKEKDDCLKMNEVVEFTSGWVENRTAFLVLVGFT